MLKRSSTRDYGERAVRGWGALIEKNREREERDGGKRVLDRMVGAVG
jgi:hypothetical protein